MAQVQEDGQFVPCECGSRCQNCDPQLNKDVDDKFNFTGTTPTYIRHAFIRKVFITTGLQLLFALGTMLTIYNIEVTRKFFLRYHFLTYAATIAYIIAVVILGCFPKFTTNPVVAGTCLLFFTPLLTLVLTGYACLFSLPEIIITLGSVILLLVVLILYSLQTKYDFTRWFTILFCLSFNLMLTTICTWSIKSSVKSIIFSGIGTVLASLWIIVDVQMIAGGSHVLQFSIDDYLFASLCLFTDIITLIMDMLRLAHF